MSETGNPLSLCAQLATVQSDRRVSAITGRWRSAQDFPRWIVLGDRFAAANLNPALARPGQKRKLVQPVPFLPLVRVATKVSGPGERFNRPAQPFSRGAT